MGINIDRFFVFIEIRNVAKKLLNYGTVRKSRACFPVQGRISKSWFLATWNDFGRRITMQRLRWNPCWWDFISSNCKRTVEKKWKQIMKEKRNSVRKREWISVCERKLNKKISTPTNLRERQERWYCCIVLNWGRGSSSGHGGVAEPVTLMHHKSREVQPIFFSPLSISWKTNKIVLKSC